MLHFAQQAAAQFQSARRPAGHPAGPPRRAGRVPVDVQEAVTAAAAALLNTVDAATAAQQHLNALPAPPVVAAPPLESVTDQTLWSTAVNPYKLNKPLALHYLVAAVGMGLIKVEHSRDSCSLRSGRAAICGTLSSLPVLAAAYDHVYLRAVPPHLASALLRCPEAKKPK